MLALELSGFGPAAVRGCGCDPGFFLFLPVSVREHREVTVGQGVAAASAATWCLAEDPWAVNCRLSTPNKSQLGGNSETCRRRSLPLQLITVELLNAEGN